MEHLTKSQIVLLTLFVSFVSSMATGIVTVTLMQQAPGPVSQSITNVVERTIEKITPTIIEKPGKTVVLKDEDLMVLAIEKNSKSVVALRGVNEAGEAYNAGLGVIVSADGLVVTEKTNIANGAVQGIIGGVKYTFEKVSVQEGGMLALGRLKPAAVTASSTPATVFTPATLSDNSTLKVGQTAIMIAGRDGKTITTGFINNLTTHTPESKDSSTTPATILDAISISERLAGSSNGAPVITLDGLVVGILSINDEAASQTGVPSHEAQKLIADYQAS